MGFHRKLQRVRVHTAQHGVALPSVEGVCVARNREYLTLRDGRVHDRDDEGRAQVTSLLGDYDVPRRLIVGMEPVH